MIGFRNPGLAPVPNRVDATSRRPRRAPIACEVLEGRPLLSGLVPDIEKLVLDLQTIHAGSSVTQAEIKAVTSDFKAIAAVATRPSASSVDALQAEIKVVVAQGSITTAEAVALKKDVTAVLVSANIPQSLAKETASDIEAVIVSSGITKADVQLIGGDIQAIVTDLQGLKH
jgi:hypothetical protein